jgi:hypothetical protein
MPLLRSSLYKANDFTINISLLRSCKKPRRGGMFIVVYDDAEKSSGRVAYHIKRQSDIPLLWRGARRVGWFLFLIEPPRLSATPPKEGNGKPIKPKQFNA